MNGPTAALLDDLSGPIISNPVTEEYLGVLVRPEEVGGETVSILEELGVERSRKAIHDWVQKADLQPTDGRSPNHVALDETVIRINDEQFWLYAVLRTAPPF